MGMVTNIQDRIYAINLTLADVTAARTLNAQPDNALLPLLTCLPGRSGRNAAQEPLGATTAAQTRQFRLLLLVQAWMSGYPVESAQLAAESLIDAIQSAYWSRPRLELDNAPLDSVSKVVLSEDTGIIAFGQYAAVEFPLAVTYRITS